MITAATRARTINLAALVLTSVLDARAGAADVDVAESQRDRSSGAHRQLSLDLEIDPTAYALHGYSLHVGLGSKRLRLDLGAFAMAVPSSLVGNQDFDVSYDGFGAKLQYFPFAEQRGGFVGVEAARVWQLTQRKQSELAERAAHLSLGVNAGWRFALGDHFHVTPWIGLSHSFGAQDVVLGGSTYEAPRLIVFPAVHIGYRFK